MQPFVKAPLFRRAVWMLSCAGLAAALLSRAAAAEPVFISEFLAKNTTGLQDEDGAFSDWVEIYNSSTNAAQTVKAKGVTSFQTVWNGSPSEISSISERI